MSLMVHCTSGSHHYHCSHVDNLNFNSCNLRIFSSSIEFLSSKLIEVQSSGIYHRHPLTDLVIIHNSLKSSFALLFINKWELPRVFLDYQDHYMIVLMIKVFPSLIVVQSLQREYKSFHHIHLFILLSLY